MTGLSAEVTGQDHLPAFEFAGNGKLEPRMSVRTLRSRRTKSGQIVEAEDPTNVAVSAGRAVSAEAAVVPRAVPHFRFRIDVKEGTFFVVAGV